MNLQGQTIAKIQQMPDSLLQEVNNFIDNLLIKYRINSGKWTLEVEESIDMAESDFCDLFIFAPLHLCVRLTPPHQTK